MIDVIRWVSGINSPVKIEIVPVLVRDNFADRNDRGISGLETDENQLSTIRFIRSFPLSKFPISTNRPHHLILNIPALMATTTVLALINTAPMAGLNKIPAV